ncbi:MAG: hypothetical protein HOO93_04175 [Methyloglobulus sp.]|nr:hypothetical protein [Methyloglobulus sp.]
MVHYKTGKGLVNCKWDGIPHPAQVKGDGLKAVYWVDRDKVTCPECQRKIGRLLLLQQSKLIMDRA